jgi:AmmeMemoRadiSam system protein B
MRDYAFAGSFYPNGEKETSSMVYKFIENASVDKTAANRLISYAAPHAGYIYSGRTAGYTYKALSLRSDIDDIETVAIVGPNHTGYGRPVSVSLQSWSTPIGEITNDKEFARSMAESSDAIEIDETAHVQEHSIEVQLPFLQRVAPEKKAVFICMGDQSLEYSKHVSDAILHAEKSLGRKITVIASSDFNHYESASVAKRKDMPLIEAINEMNAVKFNRLVEELDDSACGFGPITVSMLYAKAHGGSEGVLLNYSNSGDATKDYSSVVAYASIGFARR